MSKIVKKKLKIDGMHCTSCAMNIDMDLEDLDGLKESRTSYIKQQSTIEFDEEQLNLDSIIKTIQKIGYKATVIE